MDSEVLRVMLAIVAFFELAIAGLRGVPFVGLAMAAIGVFLGLEALRALDYAKPMHEFHCDESCYDGPGHPWQFTQDAWPASLACGPGSAGPGGAVYAPAMAAMTLAVVSFGTFTVIVAPLGDRYGI
jgi:hypothetical protein